MMIEESETPGVGSQSDAAADVLAERRARHADPAVIRRAEAAEAAVRNLETHLAALEQRLEEVGRERERISQQLTERESDVREVKQREYAEQQLRVEAEERAERLQHEMRAEIQELSRRLDDTERQARELSVELDHLRERDAKLAPIVGELMGVATKLRSGFEREFTALREEFQRQVIWERETYVRELTAMGARMEDLRFELTRTADDLRAQLAAEPPSASLLEHTSEPASEREAAHRREMADALVAAVERLRARVAEVKEAEVAESTQPSLGEQPVVEPPIAESAAQWPPLVEPSEDEEVERAYTGYKPVEESSVVKPPSVEPPVEEAKVEPAFTGYLPAKRPSVQEPAAEAPVVGNYTGYRPVEESSVQASPAEEGSAVEEAPVERPPVEGPVVEGPVVEGPVVVEPVVEGPVVVEPVVVEPVVVEPVSVESAIEEPVAVEPVVVEPVIVEPAIEGPVAAEPAVEETALEETVADEPVADAAPVEVPVEKISPLVEPTAEDVGLGAVPREQPPGVDSPLSGLSPSAKVTSKIVTSEPVALQSRLLSVPEKRISWLAPAIRRLAAQRDAKLAAELVIELLPAQRQIVDGQLNYEIKINELGAFYVALDPASAIISREPRGSVDFSLEGSVAAFSELAAGGTSRRHRGLRIRKGRARARGLLKARRRPIALADLAAAEVDVWPGLLLLVMAEAIDPSWTTGRRFELAFDIQDAAGVIIYIRVCDGEPILVSRTAVGQPIATISLSGNALVCLLAGTQAPAEHRTTVIGDATSVDMFLQWTARAQGLSAATS
jgi:hypothetical protein